MLLIKSEVNMSDALKYCIEIANGKLNLFINGEDFTEQLEDLELSTVNLKELNIRVCLNFDNNITQDELALSFLAALKNKQMLEFIEKSIRHGMESGELLEKSQ
jgi:hypothetical protein